MNPLGLTSNFFQTPDAAAMAKAKAAGFSNIEVVFQRVYQGQEMIDKARAAYDAVRCAGLCPLTAHLPFGTAWDPSALNQSAREQTLNGLCDILSLVGEWKIPFAVLHASFGAIPKEEREARMQNACRSVKLLSEHAKKQGVTLCVENLPRTALGNTADEILRLTDSGRVAPVCFDFNHLLWESHADFLQKVGALVATTHISDYDRVDEKHWLPGEGVIDFQEAITLLKGCGYQGQYLFEFNCEKALPGTVLTPKDVADRWEKLMGE